MVTEKLEIHVIYDKENNHHTVTVQREGKHYTYVRQGRYAAVALFDSLMNDLCDEAIHQTTFDDDVKESEG